MPSPHHLPCLNLDDPQQGLITVSQQSMADLQKTLLKYE